MARGAHLLFPGEVPSTGQHSRRAQNLRVFHQLRARRIFFLWYLLRDDPCVLLLQPAHVHCGQGKALHILRLVSPEYRPLRNECRWHCLSVSVAGGCRVESICGGIYALPRIHYRTVVCHVTPEPERAPSPALVSAGWRFCFPDALSLR